jgi:hypothetical protein
MGSQGRLKKYDFPKNKTDSSGTAGICFGKLEEN